MRKKISIAILVCVIIIFVFIINLLSKSSNEFYTLQGKIIAMQGDDPFEFPLYIYDLKSDELIEKRVNFYEPKYNVNEDNTLIAIVNNGDKQEICEFTQGLYEKKRTIYIGKNIENPKFVPNKDDISFIEDNKLVYYCIDKKEYSIIAPVAYPEYDWLDSDTVLLTHESSQNKTNIYAYNTSEKKMSLYKENAANPAISYNRKYLAYQLPVNRDTVYVEDLSNNKINKIQVKNKGILPFKPSNDGKYMLCVMYELSKADVVIINISNSKIKKIISNVFPSSIDWKYENDFIE